MDPYGSMNRKRGVIASVSGVDLLDVSFLIPKEELP